MFHATLIRTCVFLCIKRVNIYNFLILLNYFKFMSQDLELFEKAFNVFRDNKDELIDIPCISRVMELLETTATEAEVQ
ncbi:hypothetical protein A3Q56_08312, partial [Intoshia linei]